MVTFSLDEDETPKSNLAKTLEVRMSESESDIITHLVGERITIRMIQGLQLPNEIQVKTHGSICDAVSAAEEGDIILLFPGIHSASGLANFYFGLTFIGGRNQYTVAAAHNFSTESDNSSNHNQHEEETVTEDELKQNILNSALHFVPTHGWSVTAIAEGAKHYGYPGVAHGLFPRGGGDLMHHFVRQCNSELSQHLKTVQSHTETSHEKDRMSKATLKDALEMRLRMLIPYLEHWPQAMALTALPANIQEHFRNLYRLIDDVCFHAGDRSVDFSWYTRRLSLLAVYKSCELHIIQDESHDFQETWEFLDRRLDDFTTAGQIKEDIDRFVNPEFFSSVYNVGRNLLGVNDQRR